MLILKRIEIVLESKHWMVDVYDGTLPNAVHNSFFLNMAPTGFWKWALQIINRILTFDFMTLIGFWKRLLIPIDRVQKRLQDKTINFHNAAVDLKGLRDHFNDESERIVHKCLKNGKIFCDKWSVEFEKRPRRKKEWLVRMSGMQVYRQQIK